MSTITKILTPIKEDESDDDSFNYPNTNINLQECPKISIHGVDVHNVSRDEAVGLVLELTQKKDKFHHVLFLDPIKLLCLKKGQKLNRISKKASIVIPSENGFQWAAARIGAEFKEKISIIGLITDILRYAEKNNLTVFFLGSTEKVIEKLYSNLAKHFPKLRIVGRHSSQITKQRELMVKEAIRKTEPDILFLGMDFPKQEIWIENNQSFFTKSVVIGTWDTFEILAGEKRIPDYFQLRGLNWLWYIITHPWNIVNIYRAIYFYLWGKLGK